MQDIIKDDIEAIDGIIQKLARSFAVEDIEEVIHIDINFSYLLVLCHIQMLDEPTMGELAKASRIQISTLTRIIDKLVEREFVARKTDAYDRRIVRVSLTSNGCEIVEKYEEARKKRVGSILRRLSSEERQELLNILQKIESRIFDRGE